METEMLLKKLEGVQTIDSASNILKTSKNKAIYYIYGKNPSLEETLVYAIKTGSLRTILASLALFKKITDWSELYQISKKNRIERQVGALYDLAKKIMRVRRMPDRFRNNALPNKDYNFEYTI